MRPEAVPVRDLVLIGGGHSHVQVLRAFAMDPMPGVRLTLICREPYTPYSGMLPGHVAGYYAWDEIHIDLGPLARFAAARLIVAEALAVDPEARSVSLRGHPPVRYDVLSINTGAEPGVSAPVGIPVKPIGGFLPQWQSALGSARPGQRFVLVGGGAGGVELALSARRVLPGQTALTLLTDELLPGQNRRARRRLADALHRAGVALETGFRVAAAELRGENVTVQAADGRTVLADRLFWVTGVTAPRWLAAAGLATDADGFLAVDVHLRSCSHPEVFAAGDVAALVDQPRPKSGVFAVREGPVLADNLRRALAGEPLRRFRAQRRFLTLIGTGDGRAVASRGPWAAEGRWVWRWKERIDRRFMQRFNELPEMPAERPVVTAALQADTPEPMRCGGCGAKLGAGPLRRVLARLPSQHALEQARGVRLGIGDDAAALQVERGELLLTVDGFRHIVDDAYLFGRITAHHCRNDIFAMGGVGLVALAHATVPLMAEGMMEDELFSLLSGVVEVLNAHGVPLVGGHSSEGAELALSLTITGAAGQGLLGKGGLLAGDALILTKPLGTGVLLAAQMRRKVASLHVAAALAAMDHSNAAALRVLRAHGVRALTDVTGFGLAGHLGEMLRASSCGVDVMLADVPLLTGAAAALATGTASSLQENNERALADYELCGVRADDPRLRLLADPQTAGGLLAGVPAATADACVADLRQAGYLQAAIVGRVTAGAWRVAAP
jgi:selenide, water dikinase